MTSVTALRNHIDRLLTKIEQGRIAKTWMIIQAEGLGIPERLYPLIAPHDSIIIREIPKGYLGPDMSEPVFYSH